MSDVRLSVAAQATLETVLCDLRLVQYTLTDAAVTYALHGRSVDAGLCDAEADAVRQACDTLRAVLAVAQQNAEKGL